jgi:hypothetical protein
MTGFDKLPWHPAPAWGGVLEIYATFYAAKALQSSYASSLFPLSYSADL